MTTANLVESALLEAAYENHRAVVARLEADYTLELNAKLGQINAQAKTMRMLVDSLKLLASEGPLVDYRAIARTALEKVIPYPLPTGRTK